MNTSAEKLVGELLRKFTGRLEGDYLREYSALVEAGEWGVAFENLCVQLYEFEVHVDESEYEQIETAGSLMGLDASCWSFLKQDTSY